jgi:diguanylate cyclase (GGDEF)-like protein
MIQVFDIQTMLFMDVLIGFCLSIALGFGCRDRLVCPGFWFWLFSLASSTLGLLFLWLRWCIPLWVSVGLGNGLLLLSYALLWLGFRQYTRMVSKYDKLIFLIPVSVSAILLWLTLSDLNSIILRSEIVSVSMLCLILITIIQALKGRRAIETGRLLCVFTLIFTMASTLFRVVSIHKLDGHVSLFDSSVSGFILMIASGMSLIWTASSIMLISSQWLQQRLYLHATYDALTGIYNRYALVELSKTLEITNNLAGKTWSVAMIDIDHFKSVNDRYGHPVGDIVLREIAHVIKNQARCKDIVARYGGEEFVVVLTDCDLEHACAWSERIRKDISEVVVSHEEISVTVSIGVATSSPSIYRLQDVLSLADSALYSAKQSGRNRVVRHV